MVLSILFDSRLLPAMTECTLLRISKAEMVRVLHQEQALSDVFRFVSTYPQRSGPGGTWWTSFFNSSEKRLARILFVARPVRQG